METVVSFLGEYGGYISAGMSVVSGMQSIQQGQFAAQAQRFQGDMALMQAREKSLAYKREELNAQKTANAVLERLQRANSAVVARAAATNIQPFSGSPLDLQKYNADKAGDEWVTAQSNEEMAVLGGKNSLASGMLQQRANYAAADATEAMANARGWTSIIGGLVGFGKLGSGSNSMGSLTYENNFDNGWMMKAATR